MKTLRPVKLALFLALSLGDLLLTCHLLRQGGGQVYESNPVAAWWLNACGLIGLTAFKALIVLFISGLTVVISRYHPRAGDRVLAFACSALAVVLVYSCTLASQVAPEGPGKKVAAIRAKTRQLERKIRSAHAYQVLLARLRRDLIDGHISLPAGARQLARSERGKDPAWLHGLHNFYPGCSDEECLAADLATDAVVFGTTNPARARLLARRLLAEFQADYGVYLPKLAHASQLK